MADKFLKKKFYNPYEDENFIIERKVDENNVNFYELNYYDTYFEDYIPVDSMDDFMEENDIKEVVDDKTIKERTRKKKKEIDKIKEDEENKKDKKDKKKESSRRKRLISRIEEKEKESFLHTKWRNPNEENEVFEIIDIVNNGLYEVKYEDGMYDYIDIYEFDTYIEENNLERVASKSRLIKANNIDSKTYENLGKDGRELLENIEEYKKKISDSKNLMFNEKDQKKLEKCIDDLDNVSAFIYSFVYDLENSEVVDDYDRKIEFNVDEDIDEDVEVPDIEEETPEESSMNEPGGEGISENSENPFTEANENDQQMEMENSEPPSETETPSE